MIKTYSLGFPWKTRDPFLFCVYHNDSYPKGNGELGVPKELLAGRNIGQDFSAMNGWSMYHGSSVPGFPYHPHRGFETVTIATKGVIDHSDSLGAAGRFSNGDVQWMTAGKGVLHSEMFPLLNVDEENPLQLFQIWLNLPKRSKMVEPHFKMLWKENIPVYEHFENGSLAKVRVIAGKFGNVTPLPPTPDSWAADENNAVAVWTIELDPDAALVLPAVDEGVNRSIYFYQGTTVSVEDQRIDEHCVIEINSSEPVRLKNGEQNSKLLVLQGRPINEPVVQYGPFVMNTEQEIQEAYNDYHRTRFGGWPWPQEEMTHGKNKGRFAHHSDGREENFETS